ncbi:MAG: Kae1-associated serine/threonine protein kinase [Nitrososphaerota archaeon]|nr:Kae1-associated serine/threonine protein kinase [Nitrososphaerota archaeon]MDG6917722.1 Kae1-associated serine/threonine protein kinase [Nitrososphaerota archaeon]MDG6917890.1 Kae1-associated serine/threonine protein kinase [Nitrososphaerota archaeon]MDG6946412.1 Kae1-associated serine/threonine protein kinase [Nitrososphaerota archaeon]
MTSPGAAEGVPGRLLYRGAEADVVLGDWQGLQAVFKVRKPLTYRLASLDQEIRRQRTVHEAEMIRHAKRAGVATPFLYHLDLPASTMVMEYIGGEMLRDLAGCMAEKDAEGPFFKFGEGVARLHASGMMHGDLTTANVVSREGTLVFLDFGLAHRTSRLEDHAVDLRLIKETIVGAHPGISRTALDAFFRGYEARAGAPKFRRVRSQLRNIERRGRYARVA